MVHFWGCLFRYLKLDRKPQAHRLHFGISVAKEDLRWDVVIDHFSHLRNLWLDTDSITTKKHEQRRNTTQVPDTYHFLPLEIERPSFLFLFPLPEKKGVVLLLSGEIYTDGKMKCRVSISGGLEQD